MKRGPVNMEIVDAITDKIINFKNKDGISWGEVYEPLLDEYNVMEFPERGDTLVQIIKKLTMLNYEIYERPFKLEKWKY